MAASNDQPTSAKAVQQRDRIIASRVRERRIALGLSQQQLAERVGVTYQQLHKYEVGTTRIAAGRLFDFARALGIPVAHFFEGLDLASAPKAQRRRLLELMRLAEALSAEQQTLLLQMSASLAAPRADTPDGSET